MPAQYITIIILFCLREEIGEVSRQQMYNNNFKISARVETSIIFLFCKYPAVEKYYDSHGLRKCHM